MLEPAGRLGHIPHPRIEPLRPAYAGGEKIDVVQEHVLGPARLDRQAIVDLGENGADGIGDLQSVIAERALARQDECALNDRRLTVRSDAPQRISSLPIVSSAKVRRSPLA